MRIGRLWTQPEPEEQVQGWRPERPEGARRDAPTAPLPPVPRPQAREEGPVDVAAAADRVRQARAEAATREAAPVDVAAAARRVRATDARSEVDTGEAAQRVTGRRRDAVDVEAAAERVRARRQPAGAGSGVGGSGFEARSRPASGAPQAPRRRGWRAVAVSALVGAAVVIAAFALLGRRDNASSPLPATGGAGGRSANARAIYQRDSGSVVSVAAQQAAGRATGTGFVVDDRGTIVTNAHVVGGADQVEVRFGDHGTAIAAHVLGKDNSTDLAVLEVDSGAHSARPLPLANSDDVRVGDAVVAIGNPFGLDRTATAGIVSATGRHIEAPNGFSIDDVIQTDAPINPGNSGGPLLDARGRVIGVTSQIATAGGGGGNVGIGFAVPSNTLRQVVPRLRAGQKIRRPFLGVSTTPDPRGARVTEVTPSGPSDTAGIQAGDVVVGVDGRPVTSPDDVAAAIAGKSPGQTTQVEIVRNGVREKLDVRLGVRPDSG